MAQIRSIPAGYPQTLAMQMLRSEAQRQASMVRQEVVSDLLSVLGETREANVRSRLTKLIEHNLQLGISAAAKAEGFWPDPEESKKLIEDHCQTKPAAARKHLKMFDHFEKVHHRSLSLLKNSFEHIRVILDRLQAPEPVQ